MWDLTGPGLEPVSPALAGGFLTTAPPGKPSPRVFCLFVCFVFLKIFKIFILFIIIYFWLRWVFAAAHGLSLVVARGGYSLLQCTGFSLRWLLLAWALGAWASLVVACGLSSCGSRALECRVSSCGARA